MALIEVYNPKTGMKYPIDARHLNSVIKKGYIEIPNNNEQWGSLITDAAEKGVLNTLDLPQNIAGLSKVHPI